MPIDDDVSVALCQCQLKCGFVLTFLFTAVLFFLYRRDQREKRLADRGLSGRNVKWDEDAASRSRTSGNAESDTNMQLQDLPSTRPS